MRKAISSLIVLIIILCAAAVSSAAEAPGDKYGLDWADTVDVYSPLYHIEVVDRKVAIFWFLARNYNWEKFYIGGMGAERLVMPFYASGERFERPEEYSSPICTGEHACLKNLINGEVTHLLDMVVMGDVLGTGQLSLSQLVRMSQALRSDPPLDGVYEKAGDLDCSGDVTLSDLILLAKWLKGEYIVPGGADYVYQS